MLRTNNLGYPRIGHLRQLKKSNEAYWSGRISGQELIDSGKEIRRKNWLLQRDAGIDLIPSGDFSFCDQVLDTSLMAHTEIIRSVFPSFVSIDGAGSRYGQQAYHANEAACR